MRQFLMGLGSHRAEFWFFVGAIGLAAFFIAFPEIDLKLSAWFFDPVTGFYLRNTWWVQFVYKMVPVLTATLILAFLVLLAHNLVRKMTVGPFSTRAILYLIAALGLGPGLVVNTLFKEHWGRARPREIVELGGEKRFTPAFVISDQCDTNCSFVAAHPSIGFYFLAFGLLARRYRRLICSGAIALGAVIGFGRIVQGGHFLSDVIFSGIFVFAVAYILWRYVFRLHNGKDLGSTPHSSALRAS